MIEKTKCEHCGNPIEFEAEHSGSLVPCPHCAKNIRLAPTAKPFSPPPKQQKKPKPEKVVSPAKAALNFVRDNTCYGVLRGFINVAAGIVIVLIVLVAIMFIIGAFLPVNLDAFPLGERPFVVGVFVIVDTFLILLVIAIWQAACLLVDIADCQIQNLAAK